MPELPEVERSRLQLESIALGKVITACHTFEDSIVFSGVTYAAFATSCEGKTVEAVKRKGKNFYMILSSPPHPIFHLGMAGNTIVRGKESPTYRAPRAKSDPTLWPPKYVKAMLTFDDGTEWAFCDSRRLGRIKVSEADDPETVPPLSVLGPDAYLQMPTVESLSASLARRNAPIKAILLDQSGPVSGIGNWMADEILFQARLHPSHPASALSPSEVIALHQQIRDVTATAVNVNANSRKFPSDWLFSWRWGKGKKDRDTMILPSGEVASITFLTVGGRTSAVVEALQKLPPGMAEQLEGKKQVRANRKAEREASLKSEEVEEAKEEAAAFQLDESVSPYFKRTNHLSLATDATDATDAQLPDDPTSRSPSKKFKLPQDLYSPPPLLSAPKLISRRSSRKKVIPTVVKREFSSAVP